MGAALLALHALPAAAQHDANCPCPGGLGPGEVQIGTGGGLHGIASYPTCTTTGAPETGPAGGGRNGEPVHPSIYDPLAEAMAEQTWAELHAEYRKAELEANPRYRQYKQGS